MWPIKLPIRLEIFRLEEIAAIMVAAVNAVPVKFQPHGPDEESPSSISGIGPDLCYRSRLQTIPTPFI